MDLKAFSSGEGGDILGASGGFGGLTQRDFPKPLIAAVNGSALAGGFEIMLSCDLVVAADHATFGIPEAKRGLIAGAGGLIRMPKRLPIAVALELAMTGDAIDAQRATSSASSTGSCPADALLGEAVALAERIAANAPLAVRYSKSVMKRAAEVPEAEGWASTPRPSASCSPRPTPWRARLPSPRSARPTGRGSNGVLAPALETVRLTLHVLAATRVGRRPDRDDGPRRAGPRAGGRRPQDAGAGLRPDGLARLCRPAGHGRLERHGRPLLAQDSAWKAVLMAKIVVVLLAGVAVWLHQRATTKGQLALWGSVGGVASVAALVMGILLAG